MTEKQDWPAHARAAWEHEKRRGDRLYAALCDLERERDAALREAEALRAQPASPAEGPRCATCRHWCAGSSQGEAMRAAYIENAPKWKAECGKVAEFRREFLTVYVHGDGYVDGVEFETPATFGCAWHEPLPAPPLKE